MSTCSRTIATLFAALLVAVVLELAILWIPPWGAVVTIYRKTNFEHLRWITVIRSLDAHFPARPAPFVAPEYYSDRWTAWLLVPENARYSFAACNDDGLRLYVDGRRLIDNWCDQGYGADIRRTNVWLTAGRHALTLTHYNGTGPARLRLEWSGGPIPPETVVGGHFLRKRLPAPGEGLEP